MNKINIYFIGTPDFGLPSLMALNNDSRFNILGVITQPDKKIGRKHELSQPPIKQKAIEYGIEVAQPENIKDFVFPNKKFDFIVLIAYAQILPKTILDAPKLGCINVHGSLLPKYRGSACVQAAVLNGDKQSGVTIMKMDKGLDTGDIYTQYSVKIKPDSTYEDLYNDLSQIGGKNIADDLVKIKSNEFKAKKQDDSKASYVGNVEKKDGRIDWNKKASEIYRQIRAYHSWPGTWTTWNGKKIKIINGKYSKISNQTPGTVFQEGSNLHISAVEGSIKLDTVQLEGKKKVDIQQFSNGHSGLLGSVLQ